MPLYSDRFQPVFIMRIYCVGINHRTAPIHLREKLTFDDPAVCAGLSRLGASASGTIREAVLLSTCNRVEIYAAASGSPMEALESFLSQERGVPLPALRPHIYRYQDAEAVQHLLNVAAGLDSLVLGEPQILGQVRHALELARSAGAVGPLLNRVFESAVHAGKRARAETAISHNPASVASLAAALCERAHPNLKTAQVVVLGAGEMAELAVEAVRKHGVQKILVVNRTAERAEALAQRWSAETGSFEALSQILARADILISSTGASETLIHREMVAAALAERPHRPLVVIDIAVPRDVDPDVSEIPEVRLYDIDHLNAHLEKSLAKRSGEVPKVERILAEELAGIMEHLATVDMLPLIVGLRQQAETIRLNELEKSLRRMPDLTEQQRARIDAMSQALVKKLLEAPTRQLRVAATTPGASEQAALARRLFDLPDAAGPAAAESAD